MSGLKDKAIKWLGGFTKDEMEFLRMKKLFQAPCFVSEKVNTAKLCYEIRIPGWEFIAEKDLMRVLAEGLAKEVESHMNVETIYAGNEQIHKAEIEVVARGAE